MLIPFRTEFDNAIMGGTKEIEETIAVGRPPEILGQQLERLQRLVPHQGEWKRFRGQKRNRWVDYCDGQFLRGGLTHNAINQLLDDVIFVVQCEP
mmetsp:Transcript_8578/g.14533  ORF Transcript_8578/g.14533 Transcript_8578/m.14533 type:complete len:95 (-) Transcript_8578:504-788(-)